MAMSSSSSRSSLAIFILFPFLAPRGLSEIWKFIERNHLDHSDPRWCGSIADSEGFTLGRVPRGTGDGAVGGH
uniref:Putative secreted protein n=1 Tax=Anopheles marajoara TaxID=58244 RepID=A0A2M4CDK3_9DIPT